MKWVAHDLDNRSVGLTDPNDTITYNRIDDTTWTPAVIATLNTHLLSPRALGATNRRRAAT